MDRYAVLGQPVAHSLSPRIHRAFAAATGQAIEYTAIDVAKDALAPTLARLHADGYRGFNVTAPHKVSIAALCARQTDRAHAAGAVNTLVATAEGFEGDNTDGPGFLLDLTHNLSIPVAGRNVL